MDEELIIVQGQEDYESATVEDLSLDIEQSETVEYIEVNEPEEISIEIEETIGSPSVGDGNYAPLEHTHPISEIEELSNTLHRLASAKDHHSTHGGYAEFRPWLPNGYYQDDKIYQNTGGLGYFVSLVTATESNLDENNVYVDICKKKNSDGVFEVTDVYGVTVANSGFYGYQDISYDSLNPASKNRANDSSYAKVCLLGNVQVRVTSEDHKDIQIGDYVVPNELGYAKKSSNNVGFKVISKGQIEGVGSTITAWYYVDIALVPQNDNIARVMEDIEKTNVSLENVNIQLGNVSDFIDGMHDITIGISGKVDEFEDILNDTVNNKLPEIDEALKDAKESVDKANTTMNTVALEYADAVNKADEAKEAIYGENGVLKDIEDLQEDMQPLAEWKGKDGSKGIAGFVAQAEKDRTQLASLTKAFGEDGANLTAIIQKIDENGAAIQHLVSHVDKYILGDTPPTNGLTSDEASIMQPGIIYVPTINNEDFEYGVSYIWKANDTGTYAWTKYKDVFTISDVAEFDNIDLNKDDLWYCWQGIIIDDKYLYNPGTLYCWNGQIWVPVASANDGTSSVVSLINQTAKQLTSTYTNLKGDISALGQDVEKLWATVGSTESGELSLIEQTAEAIMMGVYNPSGSSSLGLLLGGMTSNSINVNIVKVKTVDGTPPESVAKYDYAPTWNGSEFIPVGESSETGKYYFDPNDTKPFTYYCHANDNSYDVYGINNIAMANISSRVTNAESAIEELTSFETTTSETLTSLKAQSDANSAQISSVAAGEYVVCTDINLEPTEEELVQIPTTKYKSAPKWAEDKFVFSEDDVSADGVYYMLEGDNLHYYKLLSDGKSYEQYELASSGSASIMQKVEDNSSSIGMVVDNNGVKGSIIVNAINDKSEVLIDADKIGINGTAIFTDSWNNNTTTISGGFMKSVVLQSNNYNGPVTYIKHGFKIDGDKIVEGEETDCIYFTLIETAKIDYKLFPSNGIYYLSDSIEVDVALTAIKGNTLTPNTVTYVVSKEYFDLIPFDWTVTTDNKVLFNEHITGTKIDLNSGTIFSKNFILDNDGDVSMRGSLVNNQSSIWGDRSRQTPGVYVGPDGIGVGDGAFGITSYGNLGTQGNVEVYRAYTETNDKGELVDKGDLIFGVYPYGFNGTVGTNPDYPGKVVVNGDIKLDGNIVLSGSITWSDSNSPVRVVYASDPTDKPIKDKNYFGGDHSDNSEIWHNIYQTEDSIYPCDYYASYTYDGGLTWTDAIKIRGVDGQNGTDGTNGTDAEVTARNVFNALTDDGEQQGLFSAFYNDKDRLFINAQYIQTGILNGITVESRHVLKDENGEPIIDEDGEETVLGLTKMDDGVISFTPQGGNVKLCLGYANNSTNETFIRFGAGTGAGSLTVDGMQFIKGTGMLWKYDKAFTIGLLGSYGDHQFMYFEDGGRGASGRISFHEETVIDFTDNEVKGLKITFG